MLKSSRRFRVQSVHVRLIAGATEPVWVEVLVELMLSLLSRSKQSMRSVVNMMFSVVCPHLTSTAVHLITEVCYYQ